MIMTWRLPEVKQEARMGEETLLTIEQEDTITHPFILGQLHHDAASRFIILDERSQKFHLVHFQLWEQYVKMSTTREKLEAARPTLLISVFHGSTSTPICLNSDLHLSSSLRTDSVEPPIFGSSRCQTFCSDCTPLAI